MIARVTHPNRLLMSSMCGADEKTGLDGLKVRGKVMLTLVI